MTCPSFWPFARFKFLKVELVHNKERAPKRRGWILKFHRFLQRNDKIVLWHWSWMLWIPNSCAEIWQNWVFNACVSVAVSCLPKRQTYLFQKIEASYVCHIVIKVQFYGHHHSSSALCCITAAVELAVLKVCIYIWKKRNSWAVIHEEFPPRWLCY